MKREHRGGPDKSTSPSRHRLCRRQAALHGASGAPRPQRKCPQRHHATNHRLITWRVTELFGVQRRRHRRRCREDCVFWLTEWKFRDTEYADITYVGARRPCTAFLGRRVRKPNARNVIAQAFIA